MAVSTADPSQRQMSPVRTLQALPTLQPQGLPLLLLSMALPCRMVPLHQPLQGPPALLVVWQARSSIRLS